jgi:hypothetical protein
MKLLYCRLCQDALKLLPQERTCRCGHVSGRYDPMTHHATVVGRHAEVVGLDNREFLQALKSADLEPTVFGVGPDVRSWLYPHNYDKVVRVLHDHKRSLDVAGQPRRNPPVRALPR